MGKMYMIGLSMTGLAVALLLVEGHWFTALLALLGSSLSLRAANHRSSEYKRKR